MAGKPETSRENGKKGGRPKGATTRIKVLDYFTDAELKEFWADLKIRAKTDKQIALYFAEQMTGRPSQPIEGDMDLNVMLSFDDSFKK
jgi:hypothetical protein